MTEVDLPEFEDTRIDTDPRRFDMRRPGIVYTGDLAWGSHFCLIYNDEGELRDIFYQFLQAGLKDNEHCLWILPDEDGLREARETLGRSAPSLAPYMQSGQLELLTQAQCDRTAEAIIARLDRAVASGKDGLRVAVQEPAAAERPQGPFECFGSDLPGNLNVIIACAYPRSGFDALGLMDAVKHHGFALMEAASGWEVIESSEARSAKDALKRTEEKLESVFSSMSEAFAYHRIVLDPAGVPCDYVFLEVNDAFQRQTGLNGGDIIGKRATEVLPGIEDDPNDWIGRYGRVALTGEPTQFESYSEPLDRWYSVSSFSPHKGFFAVTFSDITPRKKAELALKEREEELASIYENAPVIMLVVDDERRVRKVNRSAEDFTGESFETLSGQRAGEALGCLNSDNSEGGCGFGEECQSCPVRLAIADTFMTGDGVHQVEASRPFLIGGEPVDVTFLLSTASVNVRGDSRVLITIQDISARKEIEEQLRQTSDYLESLFSFANAPIMTWDSSLRITRFNKAFERLTGYSQAEVVGKELRMLLPEDSRDEAFKRIAGTLSDDAGESVEIPIRCKDRQVRIVLWNSVNVFGPDGKTLLATIAQAQDITTRKRAEEALRQSEQLARTLLDATEEPAMLLDADAIVLGTNEAAAAIMSGGPRPEDLVLKQVYDLLPADLSATFRTGFDRLQQTGQTVDSTCTLDGSSFNMSLYPLFSTAGKITGVAVYIRGNKEDNP